MSRWIALVSLAVVVAGCKKSGSEAEQPVAKVEAPAEPKMPEAKPTEPEPTPEAAAEEKPVVVGKELVAKYVDYSKRNLETVKWFAAEAKKISDEGKGKEGIAAATDALAKTSALTEELEKRKTKDREAAGLSDEELDKVEEVVGDVLTVRMLMKQTKADESLKSMRESLAQTKKNATPEQYAEAEKLLKETEAGFENMKNAADARKEHGDAAVDAVLAQEAELSAAREEAMKLSAAAR